MLRRIFLSLLPSIFLIAAPAKGETSYTSAPEAGSAVASGDMILVDIRSPGEWVETGVAKGAIALTMHDPGFGNRITSLIRAHNDKSIGLICATGGRSKYIVDLLEKSGFQNVIDISEGMIGNRNGPGWIARGLPLVTAEEATNAYQLLSLKP